MLSPKHSFSIDPITHNTLPKSERVEQLERMAEEVEQQKKDLSDDLPKAARTDIGKTLPSPPISPSKVNLLSPPAAANRPRVEAVSAVNTSPCTPVSANLAPPTPMLTAVTPVRFPRPDVTLGTALGDGGNESGLDALERRLLAEVGTRKMDKDDRRADVRTVLPIAIPSPAAEPLHDSAISSLTLADHDHDHDRDSDEGTHQPGKHSPLDDDKEMGGSRRNVSPTTRGEGSGRRKEWNRERRAGKKKERVKDGEAHRRRKSAKGRVAAWLGGIDPEIPPPTDLSPSLVPTLAAATDVGERTLKEPAAVLTMANVTPEKDSTAAPNPRSSGFVPIGTLNRDEGRRQSGIKERPRAHKAAVPTTNDIGLSLTTSLTQKPQDPVPNRVVLPPSELNANNQQRTPILSAKRTAIVSKPSPRLPAFPPTPSPDVKYDIRSARGGRGGRVAAVASIWASQAGENASAQQPRNAIPTKPAAKPVKASPEVPPPSTSVPKPADISLADLTARRARLIKSQSVPAAISSSHATPMLSSTASLARAVPLPDRRKMPVKLPPTVSVSQPETSQPPPKVTSMGSPQSPGRDLAFGQAKLRDLIKKYQGQATS